jgi:hypothetical protein
MVKSGGALDIEGATLAGSLKANGAALLRICGATINGPVKAAKTTGSVVVGEGTESCPSNDLHGAVTLSGNSGGVLVIDNTLASGLKVMSNGGGTTVTGNAIAGNLTVKGNTGTVIDTPNEVEGTSKIQ